MDAIGTEVGQKMRSAIKAKLMELGCYVDDELPDYIMVMVANKRSRSQMVDDLQLFLRSDTEIFVEWLQQVLKKLKEVTITNPEVCGSFRELKRKAAMEIAECVIKKEKKDKKMKTDKKTRHVEIIPEVKSITDEIPVQALKLVEKRNQTLRAQESIEFKGETSKDNFKSTKNNQVVNEDNFDIPSLAEVNELEDSQLDLVENKIKEARNRIVLMKSDSEDEDFINLRADAEELMGNELDGSNLSNMESKILNEDRVIKINRPEMNSITSPKKQNLKPSLSERLGAKVDNTTEQIQIPKVAEKRTKITVTNSKEDKQLAANRIKSIVQSIVKKPVENKVRKKESVHKRLGLPSTVVSLPKKDETEEDQPKSVMSVVKVKPRRNVSGLCQANKNLLLKAVAEAQKSVTQTPLVGREIKEKKELRVLKHRNEEKIENNKKVTNNNVNKKSNIEKDSSKVQNIIIEVKGKKTRADTDESEVEENSDGYVPTPITKHYDSSASAEDNDFVPGAIDLSYEEDLDKYMEDFDENESHITEEESPKEEPQTKHQFIVTLDGLKDKNILKSSENMELEKTEPVKKPPSPIIFDKSDTIKPEKIVPNIPDKLPKIHLSLKAKERCKYWPNCRLKEACEYVHPSTPCNMFPLCKFGDKCLYIHPKCKFDASCTRKDCPYSHGKIPIKTVVRPVPSYVVTQEVCKYHPNCSNPHCHFYHPKPCRFGKYCMNKSECTFSHGKIPNKEKLTWHSNAR